MKIKTLCVTFSSLTDFNIEIKIQDGCQCDVEYSSDGTTWNNWNGETMVAGCASNTMMYYLYMRGNLEQSKHHLRFIINGTNVEISGNLNSLLDYKNVNFVELYPHCFESMFLHCIAITDISKLILPSTKLSKYCYANMFYGCNKLKYISGNLLPATEMEEGCYSGMFYGCSSLTSIPSELLPATKLSKYCYKYMFSYSGLESIPEDLLNATELEEECYSHMFSSCNYLTRFPKNVLSIKNDLNRCRSFMFFNCKGLKNVPDEEDGMFKNCVNA